MHKLTNDQTVAVDYLNTNLITGDLKEACLLGWAGCLHADTPIYDPVANTTVSVLNRYLERSAFHVWARSASGKIVVASADPPAKYRAANIAKVDFASGLAIKVTTGHRLWMGRVYEPVSAITNRLGGPCPVLAPSFYADDLTITRWDEIVNIETVGYEPYYDFHVPIYENYWADGLFHHNTGKTYLTGYFVEKYLAGNKNAIVACTAPTNKAVHVMRSLSPVTNHQRTWFGTLHGFLGLKPRLNEDTGEETFERDSRAEPRYADLLVVDESSMVNLCLHEFAHDVNTCRARKILWVGDPAQLPPIGEEMSRALLLDNAVALREVVRHGGIIQDYVTAIRTAITSREDLPDPEHRCENDEGIWVSGRDAWLESLIADFLDQRFKDNASFVRALAWTNKAVDWGNSLVHSAIYGDDADRFMPGQTLVAHRPVMDPVIDRRILMATSDECRVISAVRIPGDESSGGSDFWGLVVLIGENALLGKFTLQVLEPTTIEGFFIKLGHLKRAALTAHPKDRSGNWKAYYRFLEKFADLKPCYWSTTHKCVHPETLVETSEGLLPIADIAEWGIVATPKGASDYANYVVNPRGPAVRFRLEHGYELTATPEHRMEVWDGDRFVERTAGQVGIGEIMRLKLGVTVEPEKPADMPPPAKGDIRAVVYETPKTMTEDLAEFFGLMVADGTIWHGGFRLLKRHEDVVERFGYLCRQLFGAKTKEVWTHGTRGYEVSSTTLSAWLTTVGGMSPNNKDVPISVLRSPSVFHRRFLRGLFEDGTVNLNGNKENYGELADHLSWFSCFPSLFKKVKIMLLRAGIVSGSLDRDGGQQLMIYGKAIGTFAETIGFVSSAKNAASLSHRTSQVRYWIPLASAEVVRISESGGFADASQKSHAKQEGRISRDVAASIYAKMPSACPFIEDRLKYHFVRVEEITKTTCESRCIEVPDGHQFLQNGIVAGNSQGSSIDRVYVATPDILRNDNIPERKRMIYTAYTRASKQLHLIG